MRHKTALVLLSGGIDSTTALAQVRDMGSDAVTVTFSYGQSLHRELEYAAGNAVRFGAVEHHQIGLDLSAISGGCALLGDGPMPVGRTIEEIDADEKPASYVPFRNGIFFAYLIGMGEMMGIEDIWAGCNGLNSGNYPDDTAEFAAAMTNAGRVGTSIRYRPRILVPYAYWTKENIVKAGLAMNVDYSRTYSCYQNASPHCGVCDSCVERKAALLANHLDIEGLPLGEAVHR
jgi:7-cyano-7-deazaguanine synthase